MLHPVSREVWLTRKDAWTEEMRRFEHDVNENTWLFEPRIEMKYTYAYSERLLADFEEIDLRIEHRSDGTEQAYILYAPNGLNHLIIQNRSMILLNC